MKFTIARRLALVAGCAMALTTAAAPSIASADVHWLVNGTFDDGGTVGGYFNINAYGYLSGYDLKTTTGTTEPGFDYNPGDSYFANGTFYVDAQAQYQSDLHLDFVNGLSVASASNPILGGSPGPSWECQGSFSCYIPQGGAIRYIAGGFASAAVPEPAAWTLMLTGFAAIGAGLRLARRQRKLGLATA
jgi:hypothetical protein